MPWGAIYENRVCDYKNKLQRNGFCAIPLILDYTTDKTTASVFFPHALQDPAVVPKL